MDHKDDVFAYARIITFKYTAADPVGLCVGKKAVNSFGFYV